MFLPVLAGSLLLAAAPVAPPNVPIAHNPESVAGCERKGTITFDEMEMRMDVPEIRSPEMRMKVANLGGNALLILAGQHPSKVTPAVVYLCRNAPPAATPISVPPPASPKR
jgi:hypothetical protein